MPENNEATTVTMESLLDGFGSRLDAALETHLSREDGPELPQPGDDQVVTMGQDGSYELADRSEIALEQIEAEMRQAITAPIESSFNGFVTGLPIGSIGVGGTTGLVVGEVVDGLVSVHKLDANGALVLNADGNPELNFANPIVKGVLAVGLSQFGGQVMSKQATLFAVGVLGVQILTDLLPIDGLVDRIVDLFNRNGTAEGGQRRVMSQAEVLHQAETIAAQAGPISSSTINDQISDIF